MNQTYTNTTSLFFSFFLTGIFFVASANFASAAKIYEGYVIKNDDTKLEGKIQMLSPTLNEVKVKFINKDSKRNIFKAKEVKEYGFEVKKWNNKTRNYETQNITYTRQTVERAPIAFGPKEVLIERQETGKINMYNHYIEQNSNVKQPFLHIVYVQKETEELVSITKKNYKKVLKEMTAEYPELQARIGSKGYGFKHISKIIATYNAWMIENGEEELSIGMD